MYSSELTDLEQSAPVVQIKGSVHSPKCYVHNIYNRLNFRRFRWFSRGWMVESWIGVWVNRVSIPASGISLLHLIGIFNEVFLVVVSYLSKITQIFHGPLVIYCGNSNFRNWRSRPSLCSTPDLARFDCAHSTIFPAFVVP